MLALCGIKSKELTDAEEARDSLKDDLCKEKNRVETLTEEFEQKIQMMKDKFESKLCALRTLEQQEGKHKKEKVKASQSEVAELKLQLRTAVNESIEVKKMHEEAKIQSMEILKKRLDESEMEKTEAIRKLHVQIEQLREQLNESVISERKTGWRVTTLLSALHSLKIKAVRAVSRKQEKVVELEKKNTVLEAKVKRLAQSADGEMRASLEVMGAEGACERTQDLHDKLGTAIDQVATYGNQLGLIVTHLEATSQRFKADKSSERKNEKIVDQQSRKKVWESLQSRSLKRAEHNLNEEMKVEIVNGQVELIQLKLREAKLESRKQAELFRIEKADLVAEVEQLTTRVIELRAMLEEKTEIADGAHEKLAAMSRQQDQIIREHTKMMQEKLDAAIALSSVHKKKLGETNGELLEAKTKLLAMEDRLEQDVPVLPFTTDHDISNGMLENQLLRERQEFQNEMLCARQVVSLHLKDKVNTGDLEKWLLDQKLELDTERLSLEQKVSLCFEPDSKRRPTFENSRKSVVETRLDARDVILVAEKELPKNDLQTKRGRVEFLENTVLSYKQEDNWERKLDTCNNGRNLLSTRETDSR